MAKRHSSRPVGDRARSNGKRSNPRGEQPRPAHARPAPCQGCRSPKPCEEWEDLLGDFSEALADVETTCGALFAVEEELTGLAGAAVASLRRRFQELKSVYSQFDVAISAMDSQ